ncbi:MAG: DUF5706 domain-containing protein [Saprospiraceae bacterium]
MMEFESRVLDDAEDFVEQHFEEKVSKDHVFHDIEHVKEVVESAEEIAMGYELEDKELELLLIAAWFHDTGYDKGPDGHEERGCEYAKAFMAEYDFTEEDKELVCKCIMATKMPQDPDGDLPSILADADMSHLGKKSYWDRCGKIRQEMHLVKNVIMSEQEWVDFEIDFLTNQRYHTDFAEELYDKRKHKHIRQLIKQKLRLSPAEYESPESISKKDLTIKKKAEEFNKKKYNKDYEIKELRLGRGVETMYRTAYRTHVNLSAMADNKANIMLSINAIIVSIVISTLVPQFDTDTKLIMPTVTILIVCLVAMFFATLATRPKVTEGRMSRDDIENRRGNLLFFGNFYKMPLDEYDWGMRELIKDSDYLYSTMTKDLYFLGIVLAKKYRFLSICYNVFLYGLIMAVLVFAITYML